MIIAQITAIGITASRHGLSDTQRRTLVDVLHRARIAGVSRFHHGCCVGGDETGAVTAHNLGYWVIGHPPIKTQWKSMLACGVSNELRDPREYRERDHDIVDEIGALIGLPQAAEDDPVSRRSGTWLTIRYARSLDRPRLVTLPNGRVVDRVGVDELWPGSLAVSTDRRIVSEEATTVTNTGGN